MDEDVGGLRHITPQDRAMYQEEYKHGIDLFQRALNEFSSAHEIHKKEAFRQVMDRALQVLNDTARGLKRQDLLEHNKTIGEDFKSYQKTQDDAHKAKLTNDLEQAQKRIG